jgi:hypothetical protein
VKNVVAILAVAGLAAVANAQATFDITTRFGVGTGATPAPVGNPLQVDITATGTYSFTLQGQVSNFAANGQMVGGVLAANHGLQSLLGNISMTGGMSGTAARLTIGAAPRVCPFTFGPGNPLNGTVNAAGTLITGIDANYTQQTVLWPDNGGNPSPTPPPRC